MRTDLENALNEMLMLGLSDRENGDVESPAGYFAVITATRDDAAEYGIESGIYFYRQDSNGLIFHHLMEDETQANETFDAYEQTYGDWLDN